MNVQTETCVGCDGPGASHERYGRKWCKLCLSEVEFEERLAARHGTAIHEVVVVNGKVGFVMEANAKKPPETLGLTHDYVMNKVCDASRELRESISFSSNARVVAVSGTTRELHRRFTGVLAEYRSFLAGGEDAKTLATFDWLAQSVGAFLAKRN